jgi:hypothetical protein
MRRLDEDEPPMAGRRSAVLLARRQVNFAADALEGGRTGGCGHHPADFGTGAWAPDDTIVFTPNYARIVARGRSGTPLKLSDQPQGQRAGHF